MKTILYISIIGTLLSGCGNFPKKVYNYRTKDHIQVEGTNVFCNVSSNFKFVKELSRFQKDNETYIQFLEINNTSYTKSLEKFKDALDKKGAVVDVYKEVEINDFNGVYLEGTSKENNQSQILLIFGADSVSVMVIGVYKTGSNSEKKEIQSILETIYYEKSVVTTNQTEFKFDRSILNYPFVQKVSNFQLYVQNGKNDYNNPNANQFYLGLMPHMTTDEGKSFIENVIKEVEINGYFLIPGDPTIQSIKGNNLLVIQSQTTYKNKEGIIIHAIISNDKESIFFCGQAFYEVNNTIENYYKIIKTIEF